MILGCVGGLERVVLPNTCISSEELIFFAKLGADYHCLWNETGAP